jgi:hypothetical protein
VVRLLSSIAVFIFALAQGHLSAEMRQRPANLPEPPPLPEEMRGKVPMVPPPNLPDPAELMDQLNQLQELIAMSPEKLARLRQSIEFIEKMSPAEREAMRFRLSQVTQLNTNLKADVDALHTIAPSLNKSDLAQYWIASSEDERADTRQALDKLNNSKEKSALLKLRVQAFVERREATLQRMHRRMESAQNKTNKN